MPSIQSLTMTYDALNEHVTFSEGDQVTGKVTLVLLKDTTIESLFIKLKGDAEVRWTKRSGDKTYTYQAHKRYFKFKQFLIDEQSSATVLPKGSHVFGFRFFIPSQSMPSSFRGNHGKIVYKLEAKLNRSWRMDNTVEKEIKFVSKNLPNQQVIMAPLVGSTEKDVGIFSSGRITLNATIDKGAYAPGETMVFSAKVNNSSSSEMIPKFSLEQKIVYHAKGHSKCETKRIHKIAENLIQAKTEKQIKCTMRIPNDQEMTIINCDIISVNYTAKVYLDISFAFDPEILLPVIILPFALASASPNHTAEGAVGGLSSSIFPYPRSPQSAHSDRSGYPGPQGYSAAPPAYPAHPPVVAGFSGAYPSAPPPVGGHYSNPVPQATSQYGNPFTASSVALHPPPPSAPPAPSAPSIQPLPSPSPTAPSYNLLPSAPAMNMDFLSQSDEPPPSYSLLFPDSDTSNAK
ncbi:arrestin domain-containing protein 3-like [Gouania willdenowi]|uniref:arrestin domain-containing protein 3-like n=1 Tax=Gouania willdenowi TaxID=441366 RepID=UPI001056DDC9|nr:arrestin domain-containing protein 3-like [Gouania willdenowi]